MITIVHKPYNKDDYEKFLSRFKFANIFHSLDMLEVFQKTFNFNTYSIFAYNDSEMVAAAFGVLVKKQISFINLKFFNRLILFSTPLYIENKNGIEGLKLILDELKLISKNNALFLEIRNSHEFKISKSQSNFIYLPFQNYLINLEKGKENIWNSLSSYTRNHIKKTEKKGGVIREMQDSELIDVIELIKTLYKRKKIPCPHTSLFYNAYKFLKPNGKIRINVVVVENKIVATRINLLFDDTIYDWYAASNDRFNKYYINESLVWDSISWACDNNFKLFDFGGGGLNGHDYGPGKFKEKFNGTLVEYGRYRYITSPKVYKILSILYEIRTGTKNT